MVADKNVVGWFEIPVADMDRAVRFYEKVFDCSLSRTPMGELEMALFPSVENGMGTAGSLVSHREFYHPSDRGVLIYFTARSGDVAIEAQRAVEAGGKILVPKRQISKDIGYMAVIEDSEGNRIALHARTG